MEAGEECTFDTLSRFNKSAVEQSQQMISEIKAELTRESQLMSTACLNLSSLTPRAALFPTSLSRQESGVKFNHH